MGGVWREGGSTGRWVSTASGRWGQGRTEQGDLVSTGWTLITTPPPLPFHLHRHQVQPFLLGNLTGAPSSSPADSAPEGGYPNAASTPDAAPACALPSAPSWAPPVRLLLLGLGRLHLLGQLSSGEILNDSLMLSPRVLMICSQLYASSLCST